MTVWLVRHAQPLIAPGVCYGALNVAADATATQEAAQKLAKALPLSPSGGHPHPFTVWVSPLQRCEQLAQALQGLRPDLAFKTDARLQEMNFGAWEGQRWDAIARHELDAWTDNFAAWRCGGGESVAQFMQRVAAAWDAFTASHRRGVWLTHAGVIRAASLIAANQRTVLHADQWPAAAPEFGQWLTLDNTARS
jgi:alpha-ribazole phosphatase